MTGETGTVPAEPKGLHMSLDELIKEKTPGPRNEGQRQQGGDMYQRRNGYQSGRGRGRGSRGQDRGRFSGFGPQQAQRWQVPGPFPEAQRLVRIDTGAEMGHPGAGPVLLLPPEFIAQQAQHGGPFGWPMGFPAGPGIMPRPSIGPGFPGMGGGFPMPAPAAPSRERCTTDEETGEVTVLLGRTEIVKVSASGEVTLSSGGSKTGEVFTALNNALMPLGIRITSPGNDQWSISDGRSLTRFHDGVTLPSKGVVSATRGKVLLAHYRTPGASSAAAAATAASNAAAAAAGLLPPEAAAGAHPAFFNGPNPGYNGMQSQDGLYQVEYNGGGPERTARFSPQQQRRHKAQGRYMPY